MKDKKFLILCVIGSIWLIIFLGLLAGVRLVNPRVEELITFLGLGWFFYWTISVIREKPTEKTTSNNTNAPKENNPESK